MTGVRFTAGAGTKRVEDCGDLGRRSESTSVDTAAAQEADPAPMTNRQISHNPGGIHAAHHHRERACLSQHVALGHRKRSYDAAGGVRTADRELTAA